MCVEVEVCLADGVLDASDVAVLHELHERAHRDHRLPGGKVERGVSRGRGCDGGGGLEERGGQGQGGGRGWGGGGAGGRGQVTIRVCVWIIVRGDADPPVCGLRGGGAVVVWVVHVVCVMVVVVVVVTAQSTQLLTVLLGRGRVDLRAAGIGTRAVR